MNNMSLDCSSVQKICGRARSGGVRLQGGAECDDVQSAALSSGFGLGHLRRVNSLRPHLLTALHLVRPDTLRSFWVK